MKSIKFLIVIIVICGPLFGVFNKRFNTYSQWEACLSNYGHFGQSNSGTFGAFWPRGSGHNYIFGSGMWYGAIAPNGDTLVTIGYGPHGGEAEFGAGPAYANIYDRYWHVYFSNDDDYPFPPVSFEDGYAVSNDFDPAYHMLNDTRPMGITVTQWSYTWPRDWADDILFLRYVIKNDTNYTINNIYAGFCIDYDIGNESGTNANDIGAGDVEKKMIFGMQTEPEGGWVPEIPGVLGLKLLSEHPLTAIKRFTLNLEPNLDHERYMTMAGYNFQNGAYEPFDTAATYPDDQRYLIATGIFSLPAGDSVVLDWALIASYDSFIVYPPPELYKKADKAQTMYNTGLHSVTVTSPNGGEIVTGTCTINYTANSITPNPLQADLFLFSENGLDAIARGVDATGTYSWQSSNVLDCVLGRIGIMVFDTITFGYDRSDGYFVVDNPGNTSPYLNILSPDSCDTLMDLATIRWFARDPEFVDSLPISIYFRGQYDSDFYPIAMNEPNDSIYSWYTRPFRNGRGLLSVMATDGVYTVAETVEVYINNRVSAGPIEHIAGLNNTVDLGVSIHYPPGVADHTYELRFIDYRVVQDSNYYLYYPEYKFDLTDSNTGEIKLMGYSLVSGYTYNGNRLFVDDYTPVIDGFSVGSRTLNDSIIMRSHFGNDSVRVLSGSYPESLITLFVGPLANGWWAYRGSHIRLDWLTKPGGGLTMRPVDMDYGDTIPYKPYGGVYNLDSAYGWNFQPSPAANNPSDTLRYNDQYFFLCGDRIRFSRTVPAPVPGDQWLVFPKPWAPPIKGNVYRFHPVNVIAENKADVEAVSFQAYPTPSKGILHFVVSLLNRQPVAIMIYDAAGRKRKSLMARMENAGRYLLDWDGTDDRGLLLPTGVYFCRLETGGFKETRKIVLVK